MQSGHAIPFDGLPAILLYTFTIIIDPPKLKLGNKMLLLGGLAPPFDGFLAILLYAFALSIHPR